MEIKPDRPVLSGLQSPPKGFRVIDGYKFVITHELIMDAALVCENMKEEANDNDYFKHLL